MPLRIESDRQFHFTSSAAAFWAAVASVHDYPRWWPWLRDFEARGLVEGDRWRCRVQPPLPYGLQFVVTLEEVVPAQLIRATVDGDLRGVARLEIRDTGTPPRVRSAPTGPAGCDVRLRSTLSPAAALPRAMAAVAPGVARFGHNWVLENGVRQFENRAL
jgi:hypothetical protein